MYIDKIYTELYSNKDWNGLEQLINEIKAFSAKDELRGLEGMYLDMMKDRRNGEAETLRLVRNHPELLQDYENAYDLAQRMEDERRHEIKSLREALRGRKYPKPNTWEQRKRSAAWREKYPIGKVARERAEENKQ